MNKEMHFLNLTNGLEFIDKVPNPQFIRVRSTTLERKDYIFLLMDLDHNFLMNLAIGNKCIVYDCGARKEFSKTIGRGVPFIRYALKRRWLGVIESPRIKPKRGKREIDVTAYFNQLYEHIFVHDQNAGKTKLKAKLDYYRKFLKGDDIYLEGVSIYTENDGDNDYWVSKTKGGLYNYGREYFKNLLTRETTNMKFGDELKVGLVLRGKDGTLISEAVETILRKDLSTDHEGNVN